MGLRDSLMIPPGTPAPGSPLAIALMGQNPQPRPTVVQGTPRSELLARALLSNGTRGDIRSPWELAGNLAQVYAGNSLESKYLADQQARAQAAQQQEYARADAMKAQERAQQKADEQAALDRYTKAGAISDPWQAALATGDPKIAAAALQARTTGAQTKAPDTQPMWDPATQTNVIKAFNPKTGAYDIPVGEQAHPASSAVPHNSELLQMYTERDQIAAQNPNDPRLPGFNAKIALITGTQAADTTRPLTPDEMKNYGIPEGTPAKMTKDGPVILNGGLGGSSGTVGTDQIKAVADGIRAGTIPPNISGRPTRYTIGIMADLAKPSPEYPKGYDLSKANEDWIATTKYIATQNSSQLLTLRNAISQVDQSINMLSDLNDKWQAGNYPPLNSIRGDAAKLGALGPEAQSIYTQMQTQVADVTVEMGSVLMKGNAPTDHGLELASKNLDINSPYATFVDSLAQMRENISYKKNSLNLGPAGVANNAYTSGLTPPPPVADPNAPPPPNIANPGSARPPAPPAAASPAAPQIKSDADYDALPSGTIFIDPNGVQRRKP